MEAGRRKGFRDAGAGAIVAPDMRDGNPAPEALDEFRVVLTAQGDAVSLAAQAPGVEVPAMPFRVPFTREEVERALADYASPTRVASDPLTAVGGALFTAVFAEHERVGRAFWERAASAGAAGGDHGPRALRLRVVTNVERVQHLPWELLFDPTRGDFMSLSGRLALVRTRPDGYRGWRGPRARGGDDDGPPEPPLVPRTRLRVLAVEADVTGTMRTGEDLAILERFARTHAERVELVTVPGVTSEALEDALEGAQFDVFHFAGTGVTVGEHFRRGGMVQELRVLGGRSGEGRPVERRRLAELLGRAGVRLAVLNACRSDWVARTLAREVPAAIGMREDVRVESCLTLVETLYRALFAGTPVDLAVTAARRAIDRTCPGVGEWGKVISYLQTVDGTFLLAPPAAPATLVAPVSPAAPVASPPAGGLVAGGGNVVGVAPAPAEVPGASASKEAVKLARLHEVYARNLAALEQMAASGVAPVGDTYAAQAADLRAKLDALGRQLGGADAG